ncbi:putative Methyltransferase domain-containing protein [Seiridium cardinale]
MTIHHDTRSTSEQHGHCDADMPSSQIGEHRHNKTSGNTATGIKESRGHYGWNGAYVKGQDSYAFMRTCNASARLTAQHYLWKDLLGYLLHPDIPARASDLKLADIATGNGIWLHDYARHKPMSVELHGFDISLDQIGPKPWRPANIHMHTWNIFEDPDPRFIGYFDVVHVKLVTVVVRNDDPRPILANLSKLLKPGGYLQWDEVDTIGCSIKTVPGVSARNLDQLFSQVRGHDTWKYQLTNVLDENGYTESQLYTYEYPLGMASFWSDLYMTTWKEFADNVLKTPETSNELEQRAMTEARLGAAIMIPKLVWVARKL